MEISRRSVGADTFSDLELGIRLNNSDAVKKVHQVSDLKKCER